MSRSTALGFVSSALSLLTIITFSELSSAQKKTEAAWRTLTLERLSELSDTSQPLFRDATTEKTIVLRCQDEGWGTVSLERVRGRFALDRHGLDEVGRNLPSRFRSEGWSKKIGCQWFCSLQVGFVQSQVRSAGLSRRGGSENTGLWIKSEKAACDEIKKPAVGQAGEKKPISWQVRTALLWC